MIVPPQPTLTPAEYLEWEMPPPLRIVRSKRCRSMFY